MRPKAILAILAVGLAPAAQAQAVDTYNGWCDASAAVALDDQHFIVANDEHNELLVYRRGQPGAVAPPVDLREFLGTKKRESDLEGAARIGNRIYWIASHGRNSKGELRTERHRLFATELTPTPPFSLRTMGTPYAALLDDLLAAESLKPFDLAAASQLAPEAPGGLNIEGLAATDDGNLLIGFRNPVRQGAALVVPLLNPDDVVRGLAKARFGVPAALDLGGAGIRSIERIGAVYWIVAGPPADAGDFSLFRWSGQAGDQPARVQGVDFAQHDQFRPEALFAVPGTSLIQILSDDGGRRMGSADCKELPAAEQKFRSITLDMEKLK